MINPYEYSVQSDSAKCELSRETALYSGFSINIPSAVFAKYLGNNRISGEYIFPRRREKAPLAILIHGMGRTSIIPCRMMARTLAKQGIASFILYLVFHDNRIPETVKRKYPRLSAKEWFESYQISVTDIRQVLDWAATRPEIMAEKIGVAGISFGGLVATIAMALDNRIQAGVLIVAGGNSEKITRDSLLLRWQYHSGREEYLQNQEAYSQYLAEVEEKGFENVVPSKSSYLTDPLTFSNLVKNRPLLMQNALWDEIIPRTATLDLWRSCGKPALNWYPATHASIWLWYPWMEKRISGFMKKAFG